MDNTTTTDHAHAIGNATAQLETLEALATMYRLTDLYRDYDEVAELETDGDDYDGDAETWRNACDELCIQHDTADRDEVETFGCNHGLSIKWLAERDGHSTGWEVTGFEWLLSTGGPACRLVAKCDDSGTMTDSRVEWQDWFTPWTAITDRPSQQVDDMLGALFGGYAESFE